MRSEPSVTTSETPNCYCQKYYEVTLADKVVGYGKLFQFVADYKNSRLLLHIPIACDSYDVQSVKIKYCPFCGRKLSGRGGDTECA